MQRITVMTTAALLLSVVAIGQSNIDPEHKWAWGENIGWTNWYDANGGLDGVIVYPTHLVGFIWAENVGWINTGNGPAGGVQYTNETGEDFGVNVDPCGGELFGLAWGENIGWINFEGGALADPPQPARIGEVCRLHGYVWGENVGWINLDDAEHYVALTVVSMWVGDLNCDCAVNAFDIDPFVLALTSGPTYDAYYAAYPDCNHMLADMNADGVVNAFDIDPFVDCLTQ